MNEMNILTLNGEQYEVADKKAREGITGKADKAYVDKTFAPAIPITMTGTAVSADMVSPIEHDVECKVSGVPNPETVTVSRYGKSLLDYEKVLSVSPGVKLVGDTLEFQPWDENVSLKIPMPQIKGIKISLNLTVELMSGNPVDVVFYTDYTDGTSGKSNTVTLNSPGDIARIHLTTDPDKTLTDFINGKRGQSIVRCRLKESNVIVGDEQNYNIPSYPLNVKTFKPSSDGTVTGMKSIAPSMTILTDNPGANLEVTYNADTKKFVEANSGGGGSAVEYDGAGYHNSVYRGKNLGSAVTPEQYARIKDGTFKGLYIGDYWTINGVDWIIAAFNYYKGTGRPKPEFSKNHVLIVPKDNLYETRMEQTVNTSTAYAGSEMRASGLNKAKEIINAAFPNHVLTKRVAFVNSSPSGYPKGGAWYDSDVDLMNERQIFGNPLLSRTSCQGEPPFLYITDTTQLPLFRYNRELIQTSVTYWLRDVTSGTGISSCFVSVSSGGFPSYHGCNEELGVRPSFIIG